jgi:Domain of unknown function (DUF5122) beta-propeller
MRQGVTKKRLRTLLSPVGIALCLLVGAAPASARIAAPPNPVQVRLLPHIDVTQVLAAGNGVLVVGEEGLTRLGPDDRIDRSFGKDGHLDFRHPEVAIQPDGRILVLSAVPSTPAPTVTRLLANGGLDPSFGSDGTANIELGPGFATTFGVAVSGHKIVILGGPERNGTVGGPSLVRLDSDGAIDRDFGEGGLLPIDVGPEYESLREMPNGDLLVTEMNDSTMREFTVDGAPVGSFGGAEGVVISRALHGVGLGGEFLAEHPPIVLPSGALIVYGSVSRIGGTGLESTPAAFRLRADGSLDRAYGKGGIAHLPFGGLSRRRGETSDGWADATATGELVISASREVGKRTRLLAIGFDRDGRLDRALGGDGELAIGDLRPFAGGGQVLMRPGGSALVFGETAPRRPGRAPELVARIKPKK